MADFTALKTAIQNAIKQNGNEEINGNLLQEVLLAIVTTLGDGSINDLVTALGTEATTRSQADGTLQQNINAEANARSQADTALDGRIDGVVDSISAINSAIENGYVYAGIATPSSTPASGKVFYLALTAGTYTNFGNTAVTQGINILKYNGSAWSLDAFIGIDDAPAPSSQKLVKSGGVFDEVMKNGSAFDLSAYNGGATYADLNAALTALNALPAAYKRGGMSMKFVQTSDNKYVQYFCKSQSFTTNVANWEKINLAEEVNELDKDVYGRIWTKDTESIYVNDFYTKLEVDVKEGEKFFMSLIRNSNETVVVYVYFTDSTNKQLGEITLGELSQFVAEKDIEHLSLYGSQSSIGTKYSVIYKGQKRELTEFEEETSEDIYELETEVYGQEWTKDTELTYVNQLSTELQVDIKKGHSFVFNLVRCDIGVTIYVKYKNTSDFTSLGYISEGETKNIIAANDIVAIYVWGSGTSNAGTKYLVEIKGQKEKIEVVEENTSILNKELDGEEWTKDTESIHVNQYYTKQTVDIKQGQNFSISLIRCAVSDEITVYAVVDGSDSNLGIITVENTIQLVAQGDISEISLYSPSTSNTGTKYTVKLLGLKDLTDKNSLAISNVPSYQFAGKNVVVLGDSHAQHRGEWMPKLCELTKMNYLSDLNAQLNISNGVPSEYEMYFHPLRVQLQSLIDNRGTTDIDVILVENVHYRKVGNAKDYSFHPSQMLSFDTYNMTKEEEEAYWQSNFASIVGSFPSSSQKADTLLKSTITSYTRVITFSSASVAAGLFTLSIDGHDFASDITSGMTLAQAIAEIYTWSFGDYCDWENISYDSTSITIRYKGSSSDPTISFAFNAGTTNISASVSESNTQSTSKVYRYLESATDSDFLVKDKWHKMDNYFYNGYRTLKGFFEDININFPNAKIVVFSVPNYMFSDFDEHLNIGDFMETQQYIESSEIGKQLLDIAELYNAITINVEKECGISPFNWFTFYSPNNVHPKTVGYERWAETIARFLI